MIDCLLVGYNEGDFQEYAQVVRRLDAGPGPARRLNLACVDIDGVPHRAMDVLNRYNGRDGHARARLGNIDTFSATIAYLGSYLARHGFTAGYVNLFQDERPALARALLARNVRAVAITTTFYVGTMWIEEIVEFVRRHDPSVAIIVGGPYVYNQSVTSTPAELLGVFEAIGADAYVISREGELALTKVLGALRDGRPLAGIDNVAWRNGDRYERTGTSTEANPLGENPVEYDLFPPERIGQFVSVRTAKSCPFSCAFCSYPLHGGAYVYEPVDTVEQELDRIRRVGTVSTITFLDDTFNVPKGRFKEMLRMMIRNGYGFRWNSFLRADHVDDECIDLMRESGCEGVFLGVESGSDTILKAMNKTARSAHYRRVIPQLAEAGILSHVSVIVGFPGETRDTVQETIGLIEDTRPDTYRAQIWYCDVSTPIWKRRDEVGLRGAQFDWVHDTMDAPTAADIVDDMFFTVRNSIWLPQHGFESNSLFYLQRKGMPIARIKRFLRHFNEAVAFRARHPERRTLEPRLLRALRTSSRFEGTDAAGPAPWLDRVSIVGPSRRGADAPRPGDVVEKQAATA